ncbi:hypothetical protein DYB32_008838, partial [Aphanomyces invadans]
CRDEFSIDGVRGWARVLHSVDLPWVPELREAMGIVRASYENSGVVFQEVVGKPGMLRVSQLWNTNLRGSVPTWIQRIGIKRRAKSVLAYDVYFRAMRLANEPLLDLQEMVPPSSRRTCFLCQRAFNTLSKRHNCRRCGQVVCRRCNKRWEITDARQVMRYVRVCFRCSAGPPIGNSLDDSEDEASVVHHDGHHHHEISDVRSEPTYRRAKSSSHVQQGRPNYHVDHEPKRHPYAPPHHRQESYPPQYVVHHRPVAVQAPGNSYDQPQLPPRDDQQKQHPTTSHHRHPTKGKPAPALKPQVQPLQHNPWDDIPSIRDLPPYPHHHPMYHNNYANNDHGSSTVARTKQPHDDDNPSRQRRPHHPTPSTASSNQPPQRVPPRGSADDRTTVSKAQLVDLYRQLKHTKIGSGSATPMSHAE